MLRKNGFYDGPDGMGNCNNIVYSHWTAMINRCYNVKRLEKFPTYKNTTVCDEWLIYSNFSLWFNENYKSGYVLDKDIIGGTDVYSPKTSAFVPPIINTCILDNKNATLQYPLGASVS